MMDSTINRASRGRGSAHEPLDEDRDLLARLLPWGVSILIHGAMVLLAILFVYVAAHETKPDQPYDTPGLVFMPKIEPTNTLKSGLGDPGKGGPMTRSLDYPGPRTSMRDTGIHSSGPRKNINPGVIGLGTGDDKAAIPFGLNGGDGGTGGGTVFVRDVGPRGARTFAFVIDASGSMIDTLPFVVAELKRTLRTLRPWHKFTIIFYQDDAAIEFLTPGLKAVTDESIIAAMHWLDHDVPAPSGLSSPLKAIEQALKHKPELMFLLSDDITGRGRFEQDQRFLLTRIRQANAGETKINTIQFLHPDPIVHFANMKPTMQLISEESKGVYRFFDGAELGLR